MPEVTGHGGDQQLAQERLQGGAFFRHGGGRDRVTGRGEQGRVPHGVRLTQPGTARIAGLPTMPWASSRFYYEPQRSEGMDHKAGTKARQAAGKIHPDMERDSSRQTLCPRRIFQTRFYQGMQGQGFGQAEAKIMVQDGDIINVRFNV